MASRNERKRKARARRQAIEAALAQASKAVERKPHGKYRPTKEERIWSRALSGQSSPVHCSEHAARAIGTSFNMRKEAPRSNMKRFS